MKRAIAILLALMLLLSLAACAAKNDAAPSTSGSDAAPAQADAPADTSAAAEKPYAGKTLTVNFGTHIDEPTTVAFFDKILPAFEEQTGAKVEVNLMAYADLNPKQTADLIAQDAADILFITGGSDFHGKSKPGLELGTGYGKLFIPEDILIALKKKRKELFDV